MKFSPSVYEHASSLIGSSPWEVSRNSDLLFQAHAAAFRTYHHDPVVVGIDIYNLEVEAYGAEIQRPGGNGIPAISEYLCAHARDILELSSFNPASDGRIPMILETAKRLAREFPEADVRVPLSGPFSIASNLVGFDSLLCDVLTASDEVKWALDCLVAGQIPFCKEVASAGLDIAFFESAATPPLLSPHMFRNIELPSLRTLLDKSADLLGHPVPCIIGGDTAPILDSIMETETGYVICPSETDQRTFMNKIASYSDVMVRINMNPQVFTSDSMDRVYAEADRVLDLAGNRQNVCIGTGGLPFNAIPDTVLKAGEYVSSFPPRRIRLADKL